MDIRSFKHQALCAAAAGAIGALGGCQSYNAAPLDARAHAAEFALRSEHSSQVADFARALAADGPAPGTDSAGAHAVAFDPADGVSCEEAEVIALVFNADLRRARAQLGVASAAAAHAGLWEDPMLGVELTRVLDRVANPNWVMATISLTIPISGRLEIEKARAGAERAAEVARVLAAEWRTRAAVRAAWAEWRAAARRHEVLQELSSQLESLVGVVDRIERAGEIAALESWRIVGRFAAPATVMEGEAWTSLPAIMTATKRTTISCVVLTLDPERAEFADIALFTKTRPDLELAAISEREYYARLGAFFDPIKFVAWVTAGLIGLGGLRGGLNTMFAAFASRVRELGTLQSLGFRRVAIAISLIQETMLASTAGSLLACAAAIALLDGLAVRFSMGAFGLIVDSSVVIAGLVAGAVLGLFGSIPPAVRCLRLPIPTALKSF